MWVQHGCTLAGIGVGAASSTVPRKPSNVMDVAGRLVSDQDEMQDVVSQRGVAQLKLQCR
jgi:hypothetical protein